MHAKSVVLLLDYFSLANDKKPESCFSSLPINCNRKGKSRKSFSVLTIFSAVNYHIAAQGLMYFHTVQAESNCCEQDPSIFSLGPVQTCNTPPTIPFHTHS